MKEAILALAVALLSIGVVNSAEPARLKRVEPEGARCGFTARGSLVHASSERGDGAAKVHVDLYCHDRSTCRCQLRYFDFPPCAADASPIEAVRRGGLEAWTTKGTLKRVGDVVRSDAAGEEFTVEGLTTSKGVPQKVRLQVFIVAGRAYILSATVLREADSTEIAADMKEFFDSFELKFKN